MISRCSSDSASTTGVSLGPIDAGKSTDGGVRTRNSLRRISAGSEVRWRRWVGPLGPDLVLLRTQRGTSPDARAIDSELWRVGWRDSELLCSTAR